MKKRLLLVDAMNMFIRSYIVVPSLSLGGEPIGGTMGFLKSLQKVTREVKPDEVIICWDGANGSRHRRKIKENYKKDRKPARLNRNIFKLDEEEERRNRKWQQWRTIEYLNQMPVIQIVLENVEADDVIAYISKNPRFSLYEKIILSMDKDFLQLLDDNTILYRPIKQEIVNAKGVLEEYGIHPNNFALARAIAGDTSDSLPGVKGVGLASIKKRLPFLSEERAVLIEEVIDFCRNQEKKLIFHKKIAESETLISENYEVMQLYTSSMSEQDITATEEKLDCQDKFFNKTNILTMMLQDGITDYNWNSLWNCFRDMTWSKQ